MMHRFFFLVVLLSLSLLVRTEAGRCRLGGEWDRPQCNGALYCYTDEDMDNCECDSDNGCFGGDQVCQTYYYCEEGTDANAFEDTYCIEGCNACAEREGTMWCLTDQEDCSDCPGDEVRCYESQLGLCQVKVSICLSGDTLVDVQGKGPVHMKDLAKNSNERILVDNDTNEYQRIYAYGDLNVYAVGAFVQVETTHEDHVLEISPEHLLFRKNGDEEVAIRADNLRVGDTLLNGDVVTHITRVQKPGLYSPVTRDGKYLANGIPVSSYTAPYDKQQDDNEKEWTLKKILSQHDMNHIAITPMRIMCSLSPSSNFCHERNADGQVLFAATGEQGFKAFLLNNGVMLQILTFVLGAVLFVPAYTLEMLVMTEDGISSLAMSGCVVLFLFVGFVAKQEKRKTCKKC